MLATSPVKTIVKLGDIVAANFDNEFVLTFLRPPQHDDRITHDVRFHQNDIGLVTEVIFTPHSFYSLGFAKVMLPKGFGWLPFGWLKVIDVCD